MVNTATSGNLMNGNTDVAVTATPARQVSMQNGQGGGIGGGGLQLTPAFILRAMWQWWKVALPVGLILGAIAVSFYWSQFSKVYTAKAWLRVERVQHLIYSTVEEDRGFVSSALGIINTPFVCEPVMANADIATLPDFEGRADPAAYLAARIMISTKRGSPYAHVMYTGPDAEASAKIVNAVVESFFKVQNQEDTLRTQRVLQLLEDEKDRRVKRLEKLREELRELKGKTVGTEIGDFLEDGTFTHPIQALASRITSSEVSREIMQARLQAIEDEIAERDQEPIPASAVDQAVDENEQVRQLTANLQAIQDRIDQLDLVLKNAKESPQYEELQALYLETQSNLDKLREELRVEIAQNARKARVANLVNARDTLAKRIDGAKLEEKIYKDRYFKQLKEARADVEGVGLDLVFKQGELRREEKVFELIAERVMRIRTELGAPAKVALIKQAEAPVVPSNEMPYKLMAIAAMVALAIPFGLAVLWEHFVRRVDGPQQLWQAQLAVVGEIAKLPVSSRMSTSMDSVGRDVSLFEESIDSLRTHLMLADSSRGSTILAVTSAVAGEGKTSVAAQLAVSIARASGEPTLLIDADMRSPDMHNVFDIPNEPGLAQVLGRECTAADAIVTTWSNYVHILPAGVLEASPHKLLGDGALQTLLDEIRGTYKHVVVDTSPILSASESLVLAKEADSTLICTMKGASRIDQVQRAYERLVNTGAKPLGAVLNGVPTGRYAYLYGIYSYPRD